MELSTSTPFSFILFGASGNLAKLKIYPALYTLALKKRLPEQYSIIGYARTEMDEAAFRSLVAASIRADMIEVNESLLQEFLSHVHYQSGQYDKLEDFTVLQERLNVIEKACSASTDCVRLGYLSIPPTVFTQVIRNICASGVRGKAGSFRCIVEKPVGHDLQSFEAIRTTLMECFEEKEIYLLDHYLGKEAVRNLYYLRFANPILERLLKNTLIHHIEVTASESLGLEGRAGYFDEAGTLRDYIQSHILAMTAMLTMRLENEHGFRESRQNALEQFYLPPAVHLNDVILQGQYGAGKIGNEHERPYSEEEGVKEGSRTNTYIALKLMTRISRWEGVPFYVRAGKRLSKRETRITIQFQETHPVGKGSFPNRLDIILQGEAGMRLHLQTKISGTEPAFRPLIMEDPLVCVGDCLPEHGILLLEAIHGKQQWFLSFAEVHAAWRLIDPLQAHISHPTTPLHLYSAGSNGPKESDEWMKKEGTEWF